MYLTRYPIHPKLRCITKTHGCEATATLWNREAVAVRPRGTLGLTREGAAFSVGDTPPGPVGTRAGLREDRVHGSDLITLGTHSKEGQRPGGPPTCPRRGVASVPQRDVP